MVCSNDQPLYVVSVLTPAWFPPRQANRQAVHDMMRCLSATRLRLEFINQSFQELTSIDLPHVDLVHPAQWVEMDVQSINLSFRFSYQAIRVPMPFRRRKHKRLEDFFEKPKKSKLQAQDIYIPWVKALSHPASSLFLMLIVIGFLVRLDMERAQSVQPFWWP